MDIYDNKFYYKLQIFIMKFLNYYFVILFFQLITVNKVYSGEIDNKGLVCSIYGDKIGFFFQTGRVIEYRFQGGESKLEIKKKDVGKYITNENSIFFGETRINRRTLKYRKYSSFRGDCKAYDTKELFFEEMDVKKYTSENKI